jgi:hypothetical protein
MYRFCLLLILTGVLSEPPQTSPSPATTQTKKQSETANQKKVQELLGARIAYAKFLTKYFAQIGRQTIQVSATDENQQTLDVFSDLIGRPSEARPTTSCPLARS